MCSWPAGDSISTAERRRPPDRWHDAREAAMKVVSRSVYLGPNLYAKFPVIRLVLDLGPLEEWPTARLGADFQKRLVEQLPGLAEHGCSYGEPGGFLRRMREDE